MAQAIGNPIRDRGFLLKSVPYGDNHRILNFLTEHHGKIGLIAFSAQNSRRRFAGALDFLHCLDLEFKPNPRGNLSQLLLCSLACHFDWIGRNYEVQILAMEWLRLLSLCLHDGQQVTGVYPLLQESLGGLDAGDPLIQDVAFRRSLLSKLGYHLNLERCLECGLDEAGLYGFVSERGGTLCRDCLSRVGTKLYPGPWKSGEALDSRMHRERRECLDFAYEEYLGVSLDRKSYG